MYCHDCGSELPENTKFCTECGALRLVPQYESEPVQQMPQTSQNPSFTANYSGQTVIQSPEELAVETRNKRYGTLLCVLAPLCILLLPFFIFIFSTILYLSALLFTICSIPLSVVLVKSPLSSGVLESEHQSKSLRVTRWALLALSVSLLLSGFGFLYPQTYYFGLDFMISNVLGVFFFIHLVLLGASGILFIIASSNYSREDRRSRFFLVAGILILVTVLIFVVLATIDYSLLNGWIKLVSELPLTSACVLLGVSLLPEKSQPESIEASLEQQVSSLNGDAPSMGFAVLGFFFPLIGLILFLVWQNQYPLKASLVEKERLLALSCRLG